MALCAGAAGLELGLKLLFGAQYRTVGYVERDVYAAANLVARMGDQTMDPGPIWDDLSTFNGASWRGVVDLVTAGFPCQPVSTSGMRKGIDDDRWLWPHVWRIIRDIQPRVGFFCENVRGLLSANDGQAFGDILCDMARCRHYDVAWRLFSASACGAPHHRERIFILGLAHNSRPRLANPIQARWRTLEAQARARSKHGSERRRRGLDEKASFPPGPEDLQGWKEFNRQCPAVEPGVRRGAPRLANRVDRIRLGGNGVVPVVAAQAFATLAKDIAVRFQSQSI
jgi:DNA (cytosine-5)-methyltransferase 1